MTMWDDVEAERSSQRLRMRMLRMQQEEKERAAFVEAARQEEAAQRRRKDFWSYAVVLISILVMLVGVGLLIGGLPLPGTIAASVGFIAMVASLVAVA